MAIVLVEESRPAKTVLNGSDTVILAAGKHVKVETSPGGEELLDAVVPAGKTWTVTVGVYILET